MTLCQTTSHQNFDDVTFSKHVTAGHENVIIMFFYLVFSPKRYKRVAIIMMTNVIIQIASRIQKPSSGAGFFRGG